jgi:hypothetical protein
VIHEPFGLGLPDVLIIEPSVGKGVEAVFWRALLVFFLTIIMGRMLPERKLVR